VALPLGRHISSIPVIEILSSREQKEIPLPLQVPLHTVSLPEFYAKPKNHAMMPVIPAKWEVEAEVSWFPAQDPVSETKQEQNS
jgi:hypothetical protein